MRYIDDDFMFILHILFYITDGSHTAKAVILLATNHSMSHKAKAVILLAANHSMSHTAKTIILLATN